LTTQTDQFGTAILESMDEAIRSLLSQEVLDAFHSNLRDKHSIGSDQIPDHLPTVSIVLRKYFGPSAQTIENTIAQRLYSKYVLEFQRNADYHLTDYVENARSKLESRSPKLEPTNVYLPLKDDFDGILVESVKEGIEEVLGKESAKAAFRFLERDVKFNELPRHLPTFYSALNKTFGKDRATVELAIVKKLYLKLSLEFTETPNTELARYVEMAFTKLSQRDQEGINISLEDRGYKSTHT
jgi:hypothetical protein